MIIQLYSLPPVDDLHQSKKGSSAGLSAGECVSLSGYVEKFDVSFGALLLKKLNY